MTMTESRFDATLETHEESMQKLKNVFRQLMRTSMVSLVRMTTRSFITLKSMSFPLFQGQVLRFFKHSEAITWHLFTVDMLAFSMTASNPSSTRW